MALPVTIARAKATTEPAIIHSEEDIPMHESTRRKNAGGVAAGLPITVTLSKLTLAVHVSSSVFFNKRARVSFAAVNLLIPDLPADAFSAGTKRDEPQNKETRGHAAREGSSRQRVENAESLRCVAAAVARWRAAHGTDILATGRHWVPFWEFDGTKMWYGTIIFPRVFDEQ